MAYLIVHDFSEIFRPGTVEPDQTAWNFAVSHFYNPGDYHRIGPAHSTVWLWLKIKVPKGNQKIITFGIVFFRSILGVQEFWALFNCVHFWWPSAEMVLVIFLGGGLWLCITAKVAIMKSGFESKSLLTKTESMQAIFNEAGIRGKGLRHSG